MLFEVTSQPLDPERLRRHVRKDESGAVILFFGDVPGRVVGTHRPGGCGELEYVIGSQVSVFEGLGLEPAQVREDLESNAWVGQAVDVFALDQLGQALGIGFLIFVVLCESVDDRLSANMARERVIGVCKRSPHEERQENQAASQEEQAGAPNSFLFGFRGAREEEKRRDARADHDHPNSRLGLELRESGSDPEDREETARGEPEPAQPRPSLCQA